MDSKELKKLAINKINEGKSRQVILTELIEETNEPSNNIAKVLKYMIPIETRKKYQLVNTILLTLLMVTMAFKLLLGASIALENIKFLPILLVIPIINIA